jgi:ribosomal protein L37AE/L43A
MCGHNEFKEVSENFIQCIECKVLIDFKNHKLHVTECPLCGSKELKPLPSGNILCGECNNSFVACKMKDN